MSFGYGVLLTPLQILTLYNAIANDGEMLKPRFINKINGYSKMKPTIFEKQILNPSICSKPTLKKIQKMMFNVVDKKWGTAHNIKDNLFNISGKTGTCQVGYSIGDVQYISSFVGYFPSENPIYSCIVVIHKPNKNKGYYGSKVAAPVFKRIAKKIYNRTPIVRAIKKENLVDKYEKKIFGSPEVSKREIFKNFLLINKDTYRYRINKFSNSVGPNFSHLKKIKNEES